MPEATSNGALARDPTRPSEPYGVHGWLAFFCLLLFLGVFAGGLRIARMVMVDSLDSIDTIIDVAFDTAYTGFAAYTGLALLHVWRAALHVVRLFCLVNLVLRLLDCLGMAMDENWTGTKVGIGKVIFAGAWLAYFYLSDRVRNTYARPDVAAIAHEFR